MSQYLVYNFYCFTEHQPENLATLQQKLQAKCEKHSLLGTILLAPEGANFGLCGTAESLDAFLAELREQTVFKDFILNKSWGHQKPFPRLKVKIQDSILTFTESDPSPSAIKQGKRLTPSEWQNLLKEKSDDVILIDTRNNYEIEWGKFNGAEDLNIKTFSDFPDEFLKTYKDKSKTYLMYCTGGIRCEKAVAWAEQQGYENSYQLDGGIVKYLEQHGSELYDGSCFVFDRRWAIDPDRDEVHAPPAEAGSVEQPKQYFEAEKSALFAMD